MHIFIWSLPWLWLLTSLLACAPAGTETNGEIPRETYLPPEVYETENDFWVGTRSLAADFNADGQPDTARTVILGGKRGLRITHGGTGERYQMGAGEPFGRGGDDWRWVDFWKLVKDSITYRQTFGPGGDVVGEEPVSLAGPALLVGQYEAGGAVIAWQDGAYRWIHQAD